jgi:branched-chain amino acid transport system permease protein
MIAMLITALANGLIIGGVYSLAAIGLTLIYGVMGVSNFSHGAMLMLGMYAVFWQLELFGINPYMGILAAVAVMFCLGWFIQRFCINRIMDAPRYNQFLLTMGISIFLESLALFLWPEYRQINYGAGVTVPLGFGVYIELSRMLAFVAAIVISAALYLFLMRTDMGKAIRATSQNQLGAQVVGVNIWKIYCLTFGIGAACAGAAGAIIAPYYPISNDIGGTFILIAFVVTCLGGLGNVVGAMVGGIIIGVAETMGAVFIPGGQKQLIPFAIFILILLFKPQGLFKFSGYWQAQQVK